MLVTIDIGNTNINFGIFSGGEIIKKFFIPTKSYSILKLKGLLRPGKVGTRNDSKLDDVIICSVVPKATKILEKDLSRQICKRPIIVGKDVIAPIKNRYRYPNQVGQDRLVNAYAGIKLFGAPLILVDFGTAITFDMVSAKKEYLGGMILPGLQLSLNALAENTALLPKIKLSQPAEFIGRDTKNSILSGIVHGFACLTDCLLTKIKSRLGKDTRVIGTGGNINFIGRYCKKIDKIDAGLTLKGLNLIYKNFS